MSTLIDQLTASGMTEAEAKIYSTLLPRPSMTIPEIISATGIPRSTVIMVVEKFARLGVIDEYSVGKRKNYVVSSSQAITRYVDEERRTLELKKARLNEMVPNLRQLHFLKNMKGARVETLKGEEGFKRLYGRTLELKKGEEILRFGVASEKFVFYNVFLQSYVTAKNALKIKTRLLIPDTPLGRKTVDFDGADMRQTRFLPKKIYNPDAAIAIWGESVSFTVWNEGLETTIITSQPVVDIMRSLFEVCWSCSNK